MTFRIYTKTGDQGKTALIGGTKVSKAHLRIEAYGNVDELNSWIGLCRDVQTEVAITGRLQEIQGRLFTIGALLAQDPAKDTKMALPDLHEEDIQVLEKEIDTMTAALPEMKSFIIPGGSVAISYLHIARCTCRRAERSSVRLQEEEPVDALIIKYLNRLSDYLFVLARYTGYLTGIADIPWRPRSS
ncbi:cob(I)yrinic acid a,c-diamide adenosyltransferase [Niabella pedocola]|uniref:Corrinoid adenosyltransferase n=1 Tax=Niabella pedocola TaxID=1752077 RepID=A0ABS8PPY6_9BACT|nr:cob(I)yrinic acid a,c-diamide adenosyltransferase [Niabella pedocola]MCD2423161.1 cob(I)yrinic acid a,c-diamide adenosyltransferase [Niabella pedocola]